MKFILGKIRFYSRFIISLRIVEKVTGVNSNVDENTHLLMWDFDDMDIAIVIESLKSVQATFLLPSIIIENTGKPCGYHAYCFKSCTFLEARTIIAATPNVDTQYLAAGISRGYFTLRFTDVKGRTFHKVTELYSPTSAELSPHDVNCFIEYTKARK